MAGYWGRPEATAKTLRDGWLHTGDAGLVDAQRYVTMRGRFSELLSIGGQTWYPRDVEDALCDEPAVAEAAVVAVDGNAVACVRLKPGTSFDEASTRSAIAVRLPYDVTAMRIVPVESFPMTPTGKIAKGELVSLMSRRTI
jgi:long-chain acyl-CoA synthetase